MSQNTVEHALDSGKHTPIGLETEDIAPDDGIRMADDTKEHVQIDPQLDRRITRRFDRRIGNAKIDGLGAQLKILTGDKFNIALGIFYVPYVIVDVPSNWVIKRAGAGYYIPAILIAWGIVSLGTGFVKTYEGLLAARFFLGLMEGGLLGGIILYLSTFYPRHQLMRRIGRFYSAAPLSGAIGGLLATGLSEIKTKNYNGWPFIFFVEGAITVLLGIMALFFLPHTPLHAKFLTEEEHDASLERMRLDSHGASTASNVDAEEFSWHWVRVAIFNWNTILSSITFFTVITPIYSFSLFIPTIISAMGYTRVDANLLSVPPFFVAFLNVLLITSLSDRYQRRGIFILGCATLAIFGYVMLVASSNVHVKYGGTFLAAVGAFPCPPIVMGWLANNTAPHYVRATASGFQIGVANLAAFVATFTYLAKDAPKYTTGHAINLGSLGLCLVSTISTMLYCQWENKKRDRGERDDRLLGDQSLLGHRHPLFRYTV